MATNQITKGNDRKQPITMGMINQMMPQIKAALPSVITPERFTRMMLTAYQTTPKLKECSAPSVLASMLNAAQLGLEPNTPLGQAYLIPYWNSKTGCEEAQFQIGYKGLLSLAYRNPEIQSIQAHTVYENDKFEYSFGLNPTLTHVPALKNRGEAICYYAIYNMANGGYGFEVMSKADIEEHKSKYSKADNKGFSPWSTNFDEMAKKTVIKKLLKYAPLSVELARAMAQDETTPDLPDLPEELARTIIDAEAQEVQQSRDEAMPQEVRQQIEKKAAAAAPKKQPAKAQPQPVPVQQEMEFAQFDDEELPFD